IVSTSATRAGAREPGWQRREKKVEQLWGANGMAVNVLVERRASERRFFYIVSLVFPLVVLFGFARSYYLKPLFASPPVPSLLFTLFFGGALYYRKRPADHKRLILLTILNFLPPAIARFPVGVIAAAGPLAFFGIPDLLAIIFLIGDTRANGKMNKVLLWGTV